MLASAADGSRISDRSAKILTTSLGIHPVPVAVIVCPGEPLVESREKLGSAASTGDKPTTKTTSMPQPPTIPHRASPQPPRKRHCLDLLKSRLTEGTATPLLAAVGRCRGMQVKERLLTGELRESSS
jgi:hypothetical protein